MLLQLHSTMAQLANYCRVAANTQHHCTDDRLLLGYGNYTAQLYENRLMHGYYKYPVTMMLILN